MTCDIMELVSTVENCKAPASLHPQHIIWDKALIEWWSTFVFLFRVTFVLNHPRLYMSSACFGAMYIDDATSTTGQVSEREVCRDHLNKLFYLWF